MLSRSSEGSYRIGRLGSRARIHAAVASKFSPSPASFPSDQTTIDAWFLSRSTIRTVRSMCAASQSGRPASVTPGSKPIPCDSMLASSTT